MKTVENTISLKELFSCTEILNSILKDIINLPYLIVYPYRISDLKETAEEGITYISRDNVMKNDKASYSNYPDKDNDFGVSYSLYEYDGANLFFTVSYYEKWYFGEISADNRYSMPMKNILENRETIRLMTQNHLVSFIIEQKSQKLTYIIKSEAADIIENIIMTALP